MPSSATLPTRSGRSSRCTRPHNADLNRRSRSTWFPRISAHRPRFGRRRGHKETGGRGLWGTVGMGMGDRVVPSRFIQGVPTRGPWEPRDSEQPSHLSCRAPVWLESPTTKKGKGGETSKLRENPKKVVAGWSGGKKKNHLKNKRRGLGYR